MAASDGVTFPLDRMPYTNNGASPWSVKMQVGTPPQELRMNIDSGANIVWLTSTLCGTSCHHYAGGYFDYAASKSSKFLDCLCHPYNFGAWGTMQVQVGQDLMAIPDNDSLPINMFWAADYKGEQFLQLEWDGGIGLPCSSAYVEGVSSFLFLEMMKKGMIKSNLPYASLDTTDAKDGSGTFQFGGVDPDKADGLGIFLPWTMYTGYPNQMNIWSSDIDSICVGDTRIQPDKKLQFDLDTGSSLFKGDDDVMTDILNLIPQGGPYPPFIINFPQSQQITVTPDIYMKTIEAGPDEGEYLPQFQKIGTPNLVYVGSVLHDYCYSIFRYEVTECEKTTFSIGPVGVYLFNKPGGPQIIQGKEPVPGPVAPTRGRLEFGPKVAFERGSTQ